MNPFNVNVASGIGLILLVLNSEPLWAQNEPEKLNVLLITSDDLNTRLACYGDPVVQTPNIDRLGGRGMRFKRAYCQYPVCNPSRTSFLSGLRPQSSGVLDQGSWLKRTMPQVVYLPEHFQAHGYFTAGIGKVEHGGHYDVKWDVMEDFKSGAGDDGLDRLRRQQRTKTKNAADPPYFAARATETDDDPENTDRVIAARVVELLNQKREQPFFIVAGFHKPHVPHVAPKRFFDLYPPEKMQLPHVPADDAGDIPKAALANNRNYQPEMPDEQRRRIIADYLACVSYMDFEVGKVLDAVDRNQLWDRTIVIFLSDHGWHFGEHNWWAKASLFEPSARVPFIIAAPGVQAGSACDRVIELLDLYPTLTEMCNLPSPLQSQGRSITPLLKDPNQPWEHGAFTVLGTRGQSVRTERHRYTEWNEGRDGAELYDYQTDTGEHTNLAESAQHQQVVKELRDLLRIQAPMPKSQ